MSVEQFSYLKLFKMTFQSNLSVIIIRTDIWTILLKQCIFEINIKNHFIYYLMCLLLYKFFLLFSLIIIFIYLAKYLEKYLIEGEIRCVVKHTCKNELLKSYERTDQHIFGQNNIYYPPFILAVDGY